MMLMRLTAIGIASCIALAAAGLAVSVVAQGPAAPPAVPNLSGI
jgi:hypothetical protein